jgi:hypothetical protein
VEASEARDIALSLPEATEQDHHGRPSFRVRGKIFATLWDEARMNVMLDEGGIQAAVQESPDVCSEVYWGKRLSAVGVDLPAAHASLLEDLLKEAWSLKAPKPLVDELTKDG